MKFQVSNEKLKKVIEKAINLQIESLKKSQELDEKPDDVSSNTIDDIHTIDSIKITEMESMTDFLSKDEVYFCELFITYDSASGIALDDIVYDIQERIKKMLGIKIRFDNFDTHNRYNDYGQM